MTTTNNCPHTPESLTEFAMTAAYNGASVAFDRLAKAIGRVGVGSGSDEVRKGAMAMRKLILAKVEELAAEFRGGGAPGCAAEVRGP